MLLAASFCQQALPCLHTCHAYVNVHVSNALLLPTKTFGARSGGVEWVEVTGDKPGRKAKKAAHCQVPATCMHPQGAPNSVRYCSCPPVSGSKAPLRDIPFGCCFFTGPWTVTHSSLRMLRRVTAFCWPLRPVLLLVAFPCSWSPVVGVLGLCWMWQGVPFARQRRPVVGVLGLCWLLRGFACFCCPHTSVLGLSQAGRPVQILDPNRVRQLLGVWRGGGG